MPLHYTQKYYKQFSNWVYKSIFKNTTDYFIYIYNNKCVLKLNMAFYKLACIWGVCTWSSLFFDLIHVFSIPKEFLASINLVLLVYKLWMLWPLAGGKKDNFQQFNKRTKTLNFAFWDLYKTSLCFIGNYPPNNLNILQNWAPSSQFHTYLLSILSNT